MLTFVNIVAVEGLTVATNNDNNNKNNDINNFFTI